MINKALQEPRNKRLILLSESEIPLYPPQAVHHQLLSETKSRIDSCGGGVSGILHPHLIFFPNILSLLSCTFL